MTENSVQESGTEDTADNIIETDESFDFSEETGCQIVSDETE